MKLLKSLLLLALAVLPVYNAHALITYGGTNSANTTDPGTGLPFSSVVEVYYGVNLVGTAVYLGNGCFITANHVTVTAANTYISFDGGVTKYSIANYDATQVASGVDLKIFYVDNAVVDSLEAATVLTTSLSGNTSTYIVGGGVGRSDSSEINTSPVTWGGVSTGDIRWGTNSIQFETAQFISYLGDYYDSSFYYTVTNTIAGANEAALANYDSGSGMFYKAGDGTWYLAGIAVGVLSRTASASTFGTNYTNSDLNEFIDLSEYADEISAIVAASPVPEPAEIAALFGAFAFALAIWRRSARRNGK